MSKNTGSLILRTLILIYILFKPGSPAFAQALGLNNSSPNASSILDATSTTKGVLIPRMRFSDQRW